MEKFKFTKIILSGYGSIGKMGFNPRWFHYLAFHDWFSYFTFLYSLSIYNKINFNYFEFFYVLMQTLSINRFECRIPGCLLIALTCWTLLNQKLIRLIALLNISEVNERSNRVRLTLKISLPLNRTDQFLMSNFFPVPPARISWSSKDVELVYVSFDVWSSEDATCQSAHANFQK